MLKLSSVVERLFEKRAVRLIFSYFIAKRVGQVYWTEKSADVPGYLGCTARMTVDCHPIKKVDAATLSSELQFSDTLSDRSSTSVMYAVNSSSAIQAGRGLGPGRPGLAAVGWMYGRCRLVAFVLAPWRSIYLRGVGRQSSGSVADAAVTLAVVRLTETTF